MSSQPPPEQYYRVDITRYPALSIDAELELFADYRRRRTAKKREVIVKQYLYWAAELACRYCGPRMSKAEAISAANYGLMQAIEKFDPATKKRFVTYSYFAIRREVLYALRDSYVVNPESGIWASRYKFKTSSQAPEDVKTCRTECQTVYNNVSTCVPVAGPGSGQSGDFGDGKHANSKGDFGFDEFTEDDCREGVEQQSMLEALRASLPSLSKELQVVVELKYFNRGQPMSFVDIGARLKCSADHVRWLHVRAMTELKKKLRTLQKEL